MKLLSDSIRLTIVAACLCLAWSMALSSPANTLTPFMPRAEDFTFLWWANGPPYCMGVRNSSSEEVLCLESGTIGLAIDTRHLKLLHAGKFAKPMDRQRALAEGTKALLALAPRALELSVRQSGRRFVCIGRGDDPKDEFYFPVRFIDSGRFLQRVAIENLEFEDAEHHRLAMKGRLEISLWPDRVELSFALEGADAGADGEMEITAGASRASSPLSAQQPLAMELIGPENSRGATIEADPALRSAWNAQFGSIKVELPHAQWRNAKGTYYPEEELDRLDRWRFILRNDTAREVTMPLVFEDEHPPAITGFTPLLCDAEGCPTGIPVQISKNWHTRPDKGTLPHQGPWFHGCTFIRLPPRTRREFTIAIAYARYGGVPAASFAQLSLVGWGHNQFWNQAAIGSFGESICYEPGRVQRRCFIDDFRPLMTLSKPGAKPFEWAGNAGGGDFLVWTDTAGHYQASRATRTDYRAYGPCLTDVDYVEETAGGEIASSMSVRLARSDDYVRVWHHLRYDLRAPVKWQRLAFFQLGADFYNDTPVRRIALGNAAGMSEEWELTRTKDVYERRGVALAGTHPWISVHDVDRQAVSQGGAAASRGLIVRSWKAVLGGKPCPQPHASFFATEWGKGNFRTSIELSPPPEITELQPGDFVEADVELVIFPAEAWAYYGPNAPFRAALEKDANTWRPVLREAVGNATQVSMRKGRVGWNYPLSVSTDRKQQAEFTLASGVGYVPVTFTGLKDYRGFDLWVDGARVDQAVHGNDFWQTDYDPARKLWSVTYNMLRESSRPCQVEFRRATGRQP